MSLAGRSAPSSGGSESNVTGVKLELTTPAPSGNVYRLVPASFLSADYFYTVAILPDWQPQKVAADGTSTPVVATLTSEPRQTVSVSQFKVSSVSYGFHLGESGIDIGISVDEGPPAGDDGEIEPTADGRDQIELVNRGGARCWNSVAEARAASRTIVCSPPIELK